MTRYAMPDGVQLNVEVWGAGQSLVLLHGFTGSAMSWQVFATQMAAHSKIIAIDLLGHGLSDSPSDPARYQMGQCVEDLKHILDTLALKRAALLGYSMGGRVALAFALQYPDYVSALILESASPGLAELNDRAARVQRDDALAKRLEQEGLESFVRYWENLPLFATQFWLPPEVRAGVRAGRLRNNPVGLAANLRGLGTGTQPENWSKLPNLNVPTLILAGSLDPKFSEIAHQMSIRISAARLQLIADAGHTIHLEQPAEFNRLVAEFINLKRK